MLETLLPSLDPWSDPRAFWRMIGEVVSVLGVTILSSRPPRERTVKDRDRQSADAEDVAAMARGDRRGLTGLYDRYSTILLGLGVRILGDRGEAEDIVHDVFIEVWSAANAYDPERGAVSTWLVMRMRSRALDRVRSAGRSRVVVSDDPAQLAPAGPLAADHQKGADAVAVQRALAELSPEQQRVVGLAYYRGLSSSEIAAETGISIGTVKSRTAAALSKLRARLGGGT